MADGHCFSTAHGIFLDHGLNLHLLHWQVDSLPQSHQENPLQNNFIQIDLYLQYIPSHKLSRLYLFIYLLVEIDKPDLKFICKCEGLKTFKPGEGNGNPL